MGNASESRSSQQQSQGSADGRSWSQSSSETRSVAWSGTSSDDVLAALLKWFKRVFSR